MKKGSSSERQCYKRPCNGLDTPNGSSGHTRAGVALCMALIATGWIGFDHTGIRSKETGRMALLW